MKAKLMLLSLAAALALTACGRDEPKATQPAASGATSAPAQPEASTPTTPANIGQPSAAEKREGANPTQQQVDPKENAQQRDFKHPGDGAGPRSAETAPR